MQKTLPLTINDIVREKAEKYPDKTVFWIKEGRSWKPFSWKEFLKVTEALAAGFIDAGIIKGDRAIILSRNRYEWEITEKALFFIGASVGGVDINYSVSEIRDIFFRLEPACLVIENSKLFEKIPPECLAKLKIIVSLEEVTQPQQGHKAIFWKELLKKNGSLSQPNVTADDDAFIIHTSGSTGNPKLIIFRHRHIVKACLSISEIFEGFGKKEVTVCWLPLANMFGRMINLCSMYIGGEIYIIPDPQMLKEEMGFINPTVLLGVPRFFEKVYEGIRQKIEEKPPIIKNIIKSSMSLNKNKKPSMLARTVDYFILKKVRSVFGRRLKFMISGSAPLSIHILDFFRSLGLPILEGYAISENAIPIAMNRPDKFRLGSVGLILSGNEIRFAQDKEILVRGEGIFEGYFNADTQEEIFDNDGSLKTGDLGYMDEDGFLFLTGRKKEMIKTSVGNRISPLEVEKNYVDIPYIENIIVIGNLRKYTAALLTINKNSVSDWCNKNKINFKESGELPFLPVVQKLIADCMESRHKRLAEFKQVKKFMILPGTFSPETGELTVNFKLRRGFIESKYNKEIERMYQEE